MKNIKPFPFLLMACVVAITGLAISTKSFPKVNANLPPNQAVSSKPHTHEVDYLFALGDTGSGNSNQLAVARAMTNQAKQVSGEAPDGSIIHVKGILHLGDIIYPKGEGDKVDQLVHQMYAPLTQLNIPFLFSLGNHDMMTHQGQDVSTALKLPKETYYNTLISKNLEVFAINTSTFSVDKAQQQWLKNSLSKSSSAWQLVFGHHPLYSTGAHGHDGDLVQLRNTLEPILVNQGVEVYLSGHDHNYERFAQDFNQATPAKTLPYLHVVSGGGGAYLRNKRAMPKTGSVFPETMHYNHALYHFLDLQVSDCTFNLQARNTQGQAFDAVELKHPTCETR
jgi:hypothetical protein